MSDHTPGPVASVVHGGFTNRLAAHLADVKNADKAHRIVRTETDQKLEALQRIVYEAHAQLEELRARLPADLGAQLAELAATKPEVNAGTRLDALVEILSGNTGEICEVCHDQECPA